MVLVRGSINTKPSCFKSLLNRINESSFVSRKLSLFSIFSLVVIIFDDCSIFFKYVPSYDEENR
jgi:hypothetical protein